jgi:hypothetical protein
MDRLVPMVAWIPMLPSDDRAAADQAAALFAGAAVTQLWDAEQRLGLEVARSFGVADRPAWDVYLFYRPGAEWTDAGLPRADRAIAQSRMAGWGRGLVDVVGDQRELGALLARIALAYAR